MEEVLNLNKYLSYNEYKKICEKNNIELWQLKLNT